MKKLALLALVIPVLAFVHACTDAGDPYIPEDTTPDPTTTDVTIDLTDMVGDWDNLHLDGALTGDTPVAMTQDGLRWSATVVDVEPGTYAYGVFHEDGTKALVAVLADQSVTVGDDLGVTGDTDVDLAPEAGTGFNMVVTNHNPAYTNIMIKGSMNEWAADITGSSADGVTFFLHVPAGLEAGSYEWGVIEDDGTEFGIWLLPPGSPNLTFDVDAEGVVTGQTTFEIASPQPVVTLTFNCDMNGYEGTYGTVQVRGTFNGWDTNPTLMADGDEDGIYSVTVDVEENSDVIFKFLLDGSTYEDVPPECGADDGFGGYNRSVSIGTADASYTASFGACPSS